MYSKVPFKVSWTSMAFQIVHIQEPVKAKNYMELFNGSLVSLSRVPESDIGKSNPFGFGIVGRFQLYESLGFGIVRCVSRKERCLYLVTNLCLEEMQTVNCLTLGCVNLPEAVMFRQSSTLTHKLPPYAVASEDNHQLNPLAEPWAKSGRPKNVMFNN